MTRTGTWLTVIAVVGIAAGALAAGLIWMVFAHPVTLAERIGGIL
jgi:hypothetical protein